MATHVKLDDIIQGLEAQSFESSAFLDKRTGEVVLIGDEEMNAAEDDEPIEDFPEWQQELITIAKEIISETGNYTPLPDKFEIDEYHIINDFCMSIEDAKLCNIFCSLIRGSGAFGRFHDALRKYNMTDDWYKFRDETLKQIAIKWCHDNNIEFDTQ